MASFEYVIKDEVGIHARPAGLLVEKAKSFTANAIEVAKDDKKADAKKLFAVLKLGAKQGDKVVVTVTGENDTEVSAELEEFFKKNL
ncbi:MAG: HPr family phosphocarrier protein [Elusimicrobiota bacterium]|jgi:phosphocarrier protein|nr:HPr family phosphocarrier protein [Elusimicrobiota bacterium]